MKLHEIYARLNKAKPRTNPFDGDRVSLTIEISNTTLQPISIETYEAGDIGIAGKITHHPTIESALRYLEGTPDANDSIED